MPPSYKDRCYRDYVWQFGYIISYDAQIQQGNAMDMAYKKWSIKHDMTQYVAYLKYPCIVGYCHIQ